MEKITTLAEALDIYEIEGIEVFKSLLHQASRPTIMALLQVFNTSNNSNITLTVLTDCNINIKYSF